MLLGIQPKYIPCKCYLDDAAAVDANKCALVNYDIHAAAQNDGKRAYADTNWRPSDVSGEEATKCTDGTTSFDCNCSVDQNVVPTENAGMFFDLFEYHK